MGGGVAGETESLGGHKTSNPWPDLVCSDSDSGHLYSKHPCGCESCRSTGSNVCPYIPRYAQCVLTHTHTYTHLHLHRHTQRSSLHPSHMYSCTLSPSQATAALVHSHVHFTCCHCPPFFTAHRSVSIEVCPDRADGGSTQLWMLHHTSRTAWILCSISSSSGGIRVR